MTTIGRKVIVLRLDTPINILGAGELKTFDPTYKNYAKSEARVTEGGVMVTIPGMVNGKQIRTETVVSWSNIRSAQLELPEIAVKNDSAPNSKPTAGASGTTKTADKPS